MMWLVEVALRRPISVAVTALLMLVLGSLSFALVALNMGQAAQDGEPVQPVLLQVD